MARLMTPENAHVKNFFAAPLVAALTRRTGGGHAADDVLVSNEADECSE